jgi:hypothetical protein
VRRKITMEPLSPRWLAEHRLTAQDSHHGVVGRWPARTHNERPATGGEGETNVESHEGRSRTPHVIGRRAGRG